MSYSIFENGGYIGTENYTYFKWDITGNKGNADTQAADFEMLIGGNPVAWDAGATCTDDAPNPGGEGPDNLIDDNSATKALASNTNGAWEVVVNNNGVGIAAQGYRWRTANDVEARDPDDWSVYGSNDGINWTPLDTVTGAGVTSSRLTWTDNYSIPSNAGPSAIRFVGSVTTSDTSGSITLPTGLIENDIVIICTGADGAFQQGPIATGFTEIIQEVATSGDAAAMYKIMGATPDTTASGLDNDARTIHMAVAFRYVDTTTPIDGTATSSSGAGGDPDPASMTTVTNNALRCIYGVQDDDIVTMSHSWDGAAPVSYYDNVGSAGNGCSIGFSTQYDTVAGAVNPPAFASSGDDNWSALHWALRPAFPNEIP